MKAKFTISIFIFSIMAFIFLNQCGPPGSETGACKERIKLSVIPEEIPADGVSTALIYGIALDEYGDPVENADVILFTNEGGFEGCGDIRPTAAPTSTPSSSRKSDNEPRQDNQAAQDPDTVYFGDLSYTEANPRYLNCEIGGDGIFSATLVSSTRPDVTAEVNVYVPIIDCEDTIEVRFVRSIPYQIELFANPESTSANRGKSYITATITDMYGNVVSGIDIDFSTTLGQFDDSEEKRTILTTDTRGMATAILEGTGTAGIAEVTAVVPPNMAKIYVTFY